jgi:PDDEXK-like domain of unknown function (DUF3799)
VNEIEITEPGLYDMPAEDYHADPVPGGSLSSTGARKLLPPSCPALFHYEREHPTAPTSDMVFGTAAHKMLFGVGPDIVTVEACDWRSKKAQQQRAEAEAAGALALLEDDVIRAKEMAAAVRRDDLARTLLDPDHGEPEQAIFWRDTETGIWRRALIDWRQTVSYGPPTVVDYKTTACADPASIRKAVARYGYHQQATWYLDAVESVGYPDDTAFKFIFQEKTPPYLLAVVELHDTAMRIGHARNRRAIEIYRDCTAAGIWPGHSTDIEVISLPAWAEREEFYA